MHEVMHNISHEHEHEEPAEIVSNEETGGVLQDHREHMSEASDAIAGGYEPRHKRPNLILYMSVDIAGNGDNSVIQSPRGDTRIEVVSLILGNAGAGAVNMRFKNAETGRAISGPIPLGINGSIAVDSDRGSPLFKTLPGEGLVINLSGAQNVGGVIGYVLKDINE